MQPVIYNYRGSDIAFDIGEGGRMINATEMARPFGKEPAHFLRNSQTKGFIATLARSANLQTDQILRTVNGGTHYGTWMHEKLALKFAAWLSAEFELWVFDRIEELLIKGKTSLLAAPTNDLALILRHAADAIEDGERAKQRLALIEPKAVHYDAVMESSECLTMEQTAKVLSFRGIGQNSLFQFLRKEGILQPNNLPYHHHAHLFKVIEQPFTKANGEHRVNLKTLVRQKGVERIRKLLLKAGCEPET